MIHMIHNYSRYRILEKFFDSPTRVFGIRELSRLTKIAQPSVKIHLTALTKINSITKVNEGLYGGYRANRDNETFNILKKQNCEYRLYQAKFVQLLVDTLQPRSIILFGSASKGEDIESSDIDIFVESKEEKLELEKYEKLLHRKINIFFEHDLSKLSKELRNNILNGIKLYGYIKVFS